MDKFQKEKTKSFKTKIKAGLSSPKVQLKKAVSIDNKVADEGGADEPPEIVQLLHLKEDKPKRPYVIDLKIVSDANPEEYLSKGYVPMAGLVEKYNEPKEYISQRRDMLSRIDTEMDLLFYTL